jgi:hypothetical protein
LEAAVSDIAFCGSTPPQSKIKRRDKDRPRRSARPERIVIGGEEFARNDILADEQGVTERTVNRGDACGAPYIYLGGVKYRPVERYHRHLLEQVKRRNQPLLRRRGAR